MVNKLPIEKGGRGSGRKKGSIKKISVDENLGHELAIKMSEKDVEDMFKQAKHPGDYFVKKGQYRKYLLLPTKERVIVTNKIDNIYKKLKRSHGFSIK